MLDAEVMRGVRPDWGRSGCCCSCCWWARDGLVISARVVPAKTVMGRMKGDKSIVTFKVLKTKNGNPRRRKVIEFE